MSKNGVRWTEEQYQNYLQKSGKKIEEVAPKLEEKPIKGKIRGKSKDPNKTELEFQRILESRKIKGEFTRIEYEGMTLKWCEMRYTPDFVAFRPDGTLILFEVKGKKIWDRDLVRFKGCRDQWPEFDFELWQKAGGSWMKLS